MGKMWSRARAGVRTTRTADGAMGHRACPLALTSAPQSERRLYKNHEQALVAVLVQSHLPLEDAIDDDRVGDHYRHAYKRDDQHGPQRPLGRRGARHRQAVGRIDARRHQVRVERGCGDADRIK